MSTINPDLPPLSIDILSNPIDKRDALKLIADSVAQQRQVTSQALIFHPICLSIYATSLAVIHSLIRQPDIGTILVTYSAVTLTYLSIIRYLTSDYIRIAEETNWTIWLKTPAGEDDTIIGARFGDEIIAALVLRLPSASASPGSNKAYIRAWTTRLRYRGRGLGGDMLSEAIRVSRRMAGSCDVEFADDHVNGHVTARSLLEGLFSKSRQRAVKALEDAKARVREET